MNAMKQYIYRTTIVLTIVLLVASCARRGNPTGGLEDKISPVVLKSSSPNFQTNFKGKTITLNFDELVKFKDLQKQLIISPPLEKNPIIKPQAGVARKITIAFQDSLAANTTYTVNFGQSIVDNNEENPLRFYKYVFSTGPVIDSLKLSGTVADALKNKVDPFINVMLYEINEEYNDSTIYKKPPNYVVNTLDSLTTYSLENLKAGTYKLVALKEKSADFKFNPKLDNIGFISEPITLPTSEQFKIQLFEPVQDPSIKRPSHEGANRLHVGYTGSLSQLTIEPLDKTAITASRITKLAGKDTLQYWYKTDKELDTLRLKVTYKGFEEETYAAIKKRVKDSLQVTKFGNFSLREPLQLTGSTPITAIALDKIRLLRKDSTAVAVTSRLDLFNNIATLDFKSAEKETYRLQLLPGAITDFFGKTNDTIKLNYTTKAIADYCSITTTLKGGTMYPAIVQIVKEDLKLVAEQVALKDGAYAFDYLEPGSFYIRIIYDTNNNGVYDPGDFLTNRQPEQVLYKPEVIKLTANRDARETLLLN
jgi:uncharacterized protein (DUF2141 family)